MVTRDVDTKCRSEMSCKKSHTAFCKTTGHGANAANKNMVTPPKLGGNPIP